MKANYDQIGLDETTERAHRVRELIAAECPGLSSDCVDGTAGGQRYLDAAARYVRTHHPDAELAFTYGSTARGNPKAFSDVDLYIVAKTETNLHVIEIFDGLPLEARIMSRRAVENSLVLPVTLSSRAVYLARALEDSRRVAGSEELLRTFRASALRWLDGCPRDLAMNVITQHRVRITNRVLDLASTELCSYRRIKAAFEITDSIRILSLYERGIFQGYNLLEHLVPIWPERARDLRATIDAVLQRNDAAPLVDLAIRALEPYGGLLVDRFRSEEAFHF